MNPTNYLANRFREVILNGTFIANTNYKKELDGLKVEIAIKKVENLNTIAILAQHIHYYISGVNQVLEGGNLEIRDQFSFDFPEITNQKEWDQFLAKFWNDAELFAKNLEQLPNEILNNPFVQTQYGTYLRNMDAMMEHAYYHLGQIVLIKKLIV